LIKMDLKKLIFKAKKSFNNEDKKEPFLDRYYVEETNRMFDLLLEDIGDFPDATDRAIYDIVKDLFREFKKEFDKVKKSKRRKTK